MELFDKKFVYFMWDDNLRGKECFYDDDIESLMRTVNKNDTDFKGCLEPKTPVTGYPFRTVSKANSWRFAYYDPNYMYKVAYSKGSRIQHREKGKSVWYDGIPCWDSRYEYRIKPVTYYVGIGENKTLTWNFDTTSYKHTYASFDSMTAANDWIVAHKKFVPVMRAFEKGLTIEYKVKGSDWAIASTPSWDLKLRYRVKPGQTKVTPHCSGAGEWKTKAAPHRYDCTNVAKVVPHCSDCTNADKSFTSEPCCKCFDGSKWEPQKRRMTNRELAQWLAEGKGQKASINGNALTYHTYELNKDDTPVYDCMIRAWNEAKWHEPDVAKEEEAF